jgi:hypothetical protein
LVLVPGIQLRQGRRGLSKNTSKLMNNIIWISSPIS